MLQRSITHFHVRRRLLPASLVVALSLSGVAHSSSGAHARAADRYPVRPPASAAFSAGLDSRVAESTPKPLATCDDAGLRDAIANASSGDTLDLTACSTITLNAGEIHVNVDDLTLVGPGAYLLTVDGGAASFYYGRIFDHTGFGTLSIQNMTLGDAYALAYFPGSLAKGGCIYSSGSVKLTDAVATGCHVGAFTTDYALGGAIYASGDVTLTRSAIANSGVYAQNNEADGGAVFVRGSFSATESTVASNTALAATGLSRGGGIAAFGVGDFDFVRSTLSENAAERSGGGAYVNTTGAVRVTNSTISSNFSYGYVGGMTSASSATIANSTIVDNVAVKPNFGVGLYAQHANLQSSIIANNVDESATTMADVFAATIVGADSLVTSASSSLPDGTITECPRLMPLADNGGPTFTHKLVKGSPAIDGGSNTIPVDTDQRGMSFARTFGVKPDIGSFEWEGENDDRIFTSAFEVHCDWY